MILYYYLLLITYSICLIALDFYSNVYNSVSIYFQKLIRNHPHHFISTRPPRWLSFSLSICFYLAGTYPAGLSERGHFINSELVWTWQDPSISGKPKSFMSSCHSLRTSAVSCVKDLRGCQRADRCRQLDETFLTSLALCIPLQTGSLIIKCQNSWPLLRFVLFLVLDVVALLLHRNMFIILHGTFIFNFNEVLLEDLLIFFYKADLVIV